MRALPLAVALLTVMGCKQDNTAPVPILLTVISTPTARVSIAGPPSRTLGQTPLTRVEGANVGDTIVLEVEGGGRHEETIQFGMPNAEKKIEKVFEKR
jgi:hypothetical protein